MRKASTEWAYQLGYKAAQQGELISANPYDTAQPSNKYAWLGGYNDFLAGHNLDLTVF